MPIAESELHTLPGAEIILPGLEDLAAGRDTVAAAAVRVAAPRLRFVGIDVPEEETPRAGEPGHHLYDLLGADPDILDPHSRYNAILGRLVSFAATLERATPR